MDYRLPTGYKFHQSTSMFIHVRFVVSVFVTISLKLMQIYFYDRNFFLIIRRSKDGVRSAKKDQILSYAHALKLKFNPNNAELEGNFSILLQIAFLANWLQSDSIPAHSG